MGSLPPHRFVPGPRTTGNLIPTVDGTAHCVYDARCGWPADAKVHDGTVGTALDFVAAELERATDMHGPMRSGHEAVAVIEEEFLEFRDAVFWGRGSTRAADPRQEAVQLAAMAIRYLIDTH